MSRHGILVGAAAALAVFATAACSAPVKSGSATAEVTTAPSAQQGMPANSAQTRLKFPNSMETALLEGYDEGVHMVRFRLQAYHPGGADNGHWETDPGDSAVHRLALADRPDIRSAMDICSNGELTVDAQGTGIRPGTADQLVNALREGKTLLVRLRVDAADHISEAVEIYRP
jgi:hypothetical protein